MHSVVSHMSRSWVTLPGTRGHGTPNTVTLVADPSPRSVPETTMRAKAPACTPTGLPSAENRLQSRRAAEVLPRYKLTPVTTGDLNLAATNKAGSEPLNQSHTRCMPGKLTTSTHGQWAGTANGISKWDPLITSAPRGPWYRKTRQSADHQPPQTPQQCHQPQPGTETSTQSRLG
jgi:hypothetical protein